MPRRKPKEKPVMNQQQRDLFVRLLRSRLNQSMFINESARVLRRNSSVDYFQDAEERAKMATKRETDGKKIFEEGLVYCENGTYKIKGRSYNILLEASHWTCTCPDFIMRRETCKHIHAVKLHILNHGTADTPKVDESEFKELIKFLAEKGNCGTINEVYEKFDTLADKAVASHIIYKTANHFILL